MLETGEEALKTPPAFTWKEYDAVEELWADHCIFQDGALRTDWRGVSVGGALTKLALRPGWAVAVPCHGVVRPGDKTVLRLILEVRLSVDLQYDKCVVWQTRDKHPIKASYEQLTKEGCHSLRCRKEYQEFCFGDSQGKKTKTIR